MALSCHLLQEDEKREICSWRYPGEYEIYDLPPQEELREKKQGFMNPQWAENYRAYYDGDVLVGFTNIREKETEVIIGVGVVPALCGRGYGQAILGEACRISKELYPDKPLYLEVRTWNKRAVNCYRKAGFQIDGPPFEQETPIGRGTFYRMMKL